MIMKKALVLLAVAVATTSVTGCGCFRRLRDFACRGAYCGSTAAAVTPVVAAPAPVVSYDPSCSYGVQSLGYPVVDDASCAYGGGVYDDGGMGGVITGEPHTMVLPGPATN